MKASTRRNLGLAVIPLLIATMFLQAAIDPSVREINKGQKTAFQGLSGEFVLGPLLGLQQAVAGLLWVRADEFFHSGDFDAILPIVRMVTWLDPHQLDVYITGAWHLAYNFTDSSERSDRRYIPASQRLLEEGDANNPEIYDIAFELGWQNSDKIKDFARAEYWYRKASTRHGADERGQAKAPVPMFVWHQLAHSLARLGRLEESVDIWKKALAMSEDFVKKNPTDFSRRNVRDSEVHNLELTQKRIFSRYKHELDWEVDAKVGKGVNRETGEPLSRDTFVFVTGSEVSQKQSAYAKAGLAAPAMAVGAPRPPAIEPTWNTAFDARPLFTAPKVLEVKGRFNVGDGARVTVRLHDDSYRTAQLKEFTFDINQDQTLMLDQHSVRAGTFGRKIDMSKDPKMYSFKSNIYYLVFEFNPRATSPFIQDRFGWSGEGMADPKYLWTDSSLQPEVRWIRKVYRITREQVFGGSIPESAVVSNEEYARVMAEPGPAK